MGSFGASKNSWIVVVDIVVVIQDGRDKLALRSERKLDREPHGLE
jgi:hypothetical protein